MPGISIHVVDVSRGVVAAGMKIELRRAGELIASGAASAKGSLDDPRLAEPFAAGEYEAVFHVGEYYRAEKVAVPARPFLGVVHYHFGIADPGQHYHLPFKCTPWGYSCFRGGA